VTTAPSAVDQSAVVKALGSGTADNGASAELPEPLTSVVGYLGDDLDRRDFVPTSELTEALDIEPTRFGRQMGELGCQPRRDRITAQDGTARQVRGYYTADLRAAVEEFRKRTADDEPETDQ
jgi:S-DNA-T family DNA segregation ATPase FtsK/SpoIIIE